MEEKVIKMMKTVLTPEESQRLIALGVDPKFASESVGSMAIGNGVRGITKLPSPQPIFNIADILSILPKEIIADTIMGENFPCALTIRWDENRKVWHCAYECLPLPLNVGESPELIDALYSLLIWCLENKIIKLKED